MGKVVAVLDTMWREVGEAPRWFSINPYNLTGKRLYTWLDGRGELLVTNACPQQVGRATHHGKPDKQWLSDNLRALWPFTLLLVCGKVAQATYSLSDTLRGTVRARVVEVPHPAARTWTCAALDLAGQHIREGKLDIRMELVKGRLRVTKLPPF